MLYSDRGFTLNWQSTHTIYENSVLCRIKQDEFNMTLNPTVRVNGDYNSPVPEGFTSSSLWNPYITTVGLYSDSGQLLVVGKLSSPLPKRDDIDMNILVRWDT